MHALGQPLCALGLVLGVLGPLLGAPDRVWEQVLNLLVLALALALILALALLLALALPLSLAQSCIRSRLISF